MIRIIFMGTPEFAVPGLRLLSENGYKPLAVVTVPDKPSGRGQKLTSSPVKQEAESLGIDVLQPVKLRDPEFLNQLASYQADLFVVVAFRMLPEVVWNMPRLGSLNLHGSLLPQYRGAAPINWAIIQGEKETGLTTFFLKHEIDTGDILLQERMPIYEGETAGELHDRMMIIGAHLLLNTLKELENGNLQPQPQDLSKVSHAPKLSKELCHLKANLSSEEWVRRIAGLSPHPGAFVMLDGKVLKIFRAKQLVEPIEIDRVQIGELIAFQKNRLLLQAIDGWVEFLEVRLEGRSRMNASDFLRGFVLNSPQIID